LDREIHFKSPSSSDIVIFEKIGSGRIQNLILPGKPVFVFDSRLDDIFLSFRVVGRFLLNLSHFKINSIKNSSTRLRGIVGQLWRIYILSVIKVINPKVIITLIDNHSVFHWLCEHYEGAEIMAVQNGNRTKVQLKIVKHLFKIQHFFCFGEYERNMYSKLGFEVDHYYPVGSLLAGYYGNKINNQVKYDICLVSSWRGNIDNSIDVQTTMKSMKILDRFLSRYINEQNLKVVIALRSEADSVDREIPVYGDEKNYYRNIYGKEIELIDPVFSDRNIFKIMDQISIIISFGSTAPREAFGFGKKILYCDFTGTDLYNDYDPIILFRDENYDLFKERLDKLIEIPQKEYEEKTAKYASYLMNYDSGYPAHLLIREKIEYYLNKTDQN